MYHWHRVDTPTASTLAEHTLTEVAIHDRTIGLLKKNGQIHAFAGKCPHAGAPLCEGWLDAQGRIVCPLHKYRFDPVNGRNTSGEGYKLFTYPVTVQDDFIYIGLMAS